MNKIQRYRDGKKGKRIQGYKEKQTHKLGRVDEIATYLQNLKLTIASKNTMILKSQM